ncbi:hypothetical protein Ctob_007228, partial [Chrysochromulina tobinii]
MNGQQYSRSGVVFAYHTPEQVIGVSPSSGMHTGSTYVRVLGTGFQPFSGALCRFGDTNASVHATYVSSEEMRCASVPARSSGASVSVWLDFEGADELEGLATLHTAGPRGALVVGGELSLTSEQTKQISALVTHEHLMADPRQLYVAASFDLYIGGGTGGGGEGVSVCFGDLPDAPFGEEGAGDGLRVSLLTSTGRLEVRYAGELIVSRPMESSLVRLARFVRVSVAYMSTGLRVLVGGLPLINGLILGGWLPRRSWRFGLGSRTGEARTDVHRLDNVLVVSGAEVEARGSSVEVASNGQQFTSSSVVFVYSAPHAVSSVHPERGPESGATLVTVAGANFGAGSEYKCRFGSATVNASFHAVDSTIHCASSPMPLGRVPVEISLNAQQYTKSFVDFTYYRAPALSAVSPSAGPTAGDTLVRLTGDGLAAGRTYRCRFDDLVVPATLDNSGAASTLLCVSPTMTAASLSAELTREVSLEVALNSQDYSPGWRFGFGARTSSAVDEHLLSGVEIVADALTEADPVTVEVTLNGQQFGVSTASYSY